MPTLTNPVKWSSIWDALEEGVCIVGDDYTIEFMNPSMIRWFGNAMGRPCREVFPCADSADGTCAGGPVFQGETVRFHCAAKKQRRRFEVIEAPLPGPDKEILKLVSVWKDAERRGGRDEGRPSAEEDYQRLFEHVGCGVFISTQDGKMLNANRAMLDMLGYDRKEDFLKVDISRDLYLRSGDRGVFREKIERNGHLADFEVVLKTRDGRPVPVSITSHVRYDRAGNVLGYEGILVDLTHRRIMEQKLKETNDFLDKILQSSPNAIMAADMAGNILFWNHGAEDILGYCAEELIGRKNIVELYPTGTFERILEMMRSPEYGGIGKLRSCPMVLKRRSGERVEGNFSAAILYGSDGNEVAWVGLFVDLEERLKTERKLMETQEQLFQAEKLASIGRLAAGVAHELNNPIGAILLYSHLVLEDLPKNDIACENQQKVVAQADRCKKIVEGLLDFARQREPEIKPVDVNQLLAEAMSLVAIQGLFQNIEVSSNLDAGLPPIMGDKSQIQQVLINLAINAAEAMKGCGALTVETTSRPGFVEIAISDSGCGLPPEDVDKIFEPFFTTKSDQRGTGLGLAVSHGIIHKHGGTITVQSKINEGSCFRIRLPVEGREEKS